MPTLFFCEHQIFILTKKTSTHFGASSFLCFVWSIICLAQHLLVPLSSCATLAKLLEQYHNRPDLWRTKPFHNSLAQLTSHDNTSWSNIEVQVSITNLTPCIFYSLGAPQSNFSLDVPYFFLLMHNILFCVSLGVQVSHFLSNNLALLSDHHVTYSAICFGASTFGTSIIKLCLDDFLACLTLS